VVVDLDGDRGARDGDKRTGRLVRQTILDILVDAVEAGGQVPGVEELLAGNEIGAALFTLNASLGRVARLDAVHVELAELILQVGVVDQEADTAVLVLLNQTVLVVLLGPLVDETTGESLSHLLAVESLNLGEDTGLDLVAAILGEENRHGRVGEVVRQDVVATRLVRSLATPGVGVQTEEVSLGASRVLHVALEVAIGVHQNVTNIGGGVSDGNGTVGVLSDIVLHITNDSLGYVST